MTVIVGALYGFGHLAYIQWRRRKADTFLLNESWAAGNDGLAESAADSGPDVSKDVASATSSGEVKAAKYASAIAQAAPSLAYDKV